MIENKKKFNGFPGASQSDWRVAAQEELKGADPLKKLSTTGKDWSIYPYYDRKGVPDASPLLKASENRFLGNRAWYNCPSLLVTDPIISNRLALGHLNSGADGILFELDQEVNLKILLKDIEWGACSLNFLAKRNADQISALLKDFILKNNLQGADLHGAFFGNSVSKSISECSFRFSGYEVTPTASPVDEITSAFRWLAETGTKNLESCANQFAFLVPFGTDFFLDLAKLRAYRLTWKRFLESSGSKDDFSLVLHARSHRWINAAFEPNGNMLKGTTAAMAAILGGCDALTVDAEREEDNMMVRVARNISNLLREESHFSKVADPVAGSYFVEDLSRQLAESAWRNIKPNLPA